MKLFVIFILLFANTTLYAQEIKRCASYEVLERQKTKDPTIAGRELETEEKIKKYLKDNLLYHSQRVSNDEKINTTLIIPIVVHVVYNTNDENISDQQIQSQLSIINKDYQRLNSDTGLTPAPFRSVAGRMNIQFAFAMIDPKGYKTNGILRKYSANNSFTNDDAVKLPSQGGDTAWPAKKYLNIWVCNLSGNFLGYTQLPVVNQPTTDGVVIHYRAFGNIGAASPPYHLGRTATHEIGHWLNLRHIWGDATCGDDFVADTPTQYTDHGGQCPFFPSISPAPCANGSNGDMFMNYLDYTNDACMNMFSNGQIQRMLAALHVFPLRDSLVNNASSVTAISVLNSTVNNYSFNLQPNNQGILNISYSFPDIQNMKFSIFDITGRKVYFMFYPDLISGNITITNANLMNGLYIIQSEIANQTFTKKLVIE